MPLRSSKNGTQEPKTNTVQPKTDVANYLIVKFGATKKTLTRVTRARERGKVLAPGGYEGKNCFNGRWLLFGTRSFNILYPFLILLTPPPTPPLQGRGVPTEFQAAGKAAAAPLPCRGGVGGGVSNFRQ